MGHCFFLRLRRDLRIGQNTPGAAPTTHTHAVFMHLLHAVPNAINSDDCDVDAVVMLAASLA